MFIKVIKTLRNHWKKSVFFSCVAIFGGNYLNNKLIDYNLMRKYCLEASSYGHVPLDPFLQPRHITVILNPIAKNKKGKILYEKFAAPLFNLAGLKVSLVVTESEGQAKDLMEIMDNTDGVVVVGGNGTVHEAVTGLLRRADAAIAVKRFPIGIIPIGKRNTIAYALYGFRKDQLSDAEILAKSAMSVIRENIKPVDVMKIEGTHGKAVFALEGLNYGAFRDTLINIDKYWYFGSKLKPYFALFFASFKDLLYDELNVSYTNPCTGCSNCYERLEVQSRGDKQKRWWNVFIPRNRNENTAETHTPIDYRSIINEKCGKWSHLKLNPLNLYIRNTNESKLELNVHLNSMSTAQFVEDGVTFYSNPNAMLKHKSETIDAQDIKLEISEEDKSNGEDHGNDDGGNGTGGVNGNKWFSIDTENYEAVSVNIKLLPKKLRIYF